LDIYLALSGLPTDVNEIRKPHIESYIASILENRSSATARLRYASLQQFFKWLTAEDEIDENPMARTEPPTVVEKPIPVLNVDEIRALLKAGRSSNPFESSRDEAIIRMFLDTGVRLGEMTGLKMSDVDLKLQVAVVMGKGSRFRTVPFDVGTAGALDRYRRRRLRHKYAASGSLWLGARGPLSASGITQIIRRRSADAGLPRIHPHQFRHTFAHRWLSMGGNEGDLQRIAGWSSPQMLARYGASAAEERAQEAHRRIGLWDDL
jgi:site-specific recombinase XerD